MTTASVGWESLKDATAHFSVDIFPVAAPSYLLVTPRDSRKLPPELLGTISLKCATTSLRTIAEEYGVSYESVRRAVLQPKPPQTGEDAWHVPQNDPKKPAKLALKSVCGIVV